MVVAMVFIGSTVCCICALVVIGCLLRHQRRNVMRSESGNIIYTGSRDHFMLDDVNFTNSALDNITDPDDEL